MDERLVGLLDMIDKESKNKGAVRFGPYFVEHTKDKRVLKVVSSQGGYIVRFYFGKASDGKTKYVTRHVETYKDALKLCSDLNEHRDEAEKLFSRVTLDIAMEDYTNSVSFHNESLSHQAGMKQKQGNVSKYLGNKLTKDITVYDIEEFYRERMGIDTDGHLIRTNGNVTYATMNRYKSFLSNVWKFMTHSDKYGVTRNIIRDTEIPVPKTNVNGVEVKMKTNHIAKSFTVDELNITLNDALLNEKDLSLEVLLMFGAVAGLRKSELLGLRVSRLLREDDLTVNIDNLRAADCNLEFYKEHKELVLIDQALVVVPGKEIMKLPKDDKPRVIAVPNILIEVFKRVMDQRQQWMDKLKEHGSLNLERDYDFVFYPLRNIIEDRKRPGNIDDLWVNYQKRRNKRLVEQGLPEIEQIRLHDLRHTHANLLRLGGVPEYEISKNMGHSITGSVTRTNYFDDYRPNRKEIIDYFDSHIHLNFEEYAKSSH